MKDNKNNYLTKFLSWLSVPAKGQQSFLIRLAIFWIIMTAIIVIDPNQMLDDITVGKPAPKNLICPKYIDICSSESGKLCNDMFECLDKQSKVEEDTYSYVPGQKDSVAYNDPLREDNTNDDTVTDEVIRVFNNNYHKYMKYNYDFILLLVLMIFN